MTLISCQQPLTHSILRGLIYKAPSIYIVLDAFAINGKVTILVLIVLSQVEQVL